MQLRRRAKRLVVLLLLPSLSALAAPDSFALGDGHRGPLTVASGSVVVNTYRQVASAVAAGDTSVSLSSTTGFAQGDLILLLQLNGFPSQPAGAPGPFSLDGTRVGQWELARVASVSPSALQLTAPVVHAFEGLRTQAIVVPEYTTVSVASGATLTATAWNGSTGGVLAFLATGTVTNDGAIAVDGKGMRGGLVVTDPTGASGCTDLNQAAPLGAQRGEGVVAGAYGPGKTGYGNMVNGGGGGNCHNAGGGGGGNGGPGGQGGTSWDGDRDVGGRGGAALQYSLLDRLLLGGGGGTAHDHQLTAGPGGGGGGAIFIRAAVLAGNGRISADGQDGVTASHDGGSGGGAGGCIYLRLAGPASASILEAKGGNGGWNTGVNVGRGGGGGGGGKIFIQASSLSVTPSVSSGIAGQAGSPPAYYLAQPQSTGDVTYAGLVTSPPGALAIPAAPSLTAPDASALLNTPTPSFTGVVTPGALAIVLLDGVEQPPVTALADGSFVFVPSASLPDGPHTVQVVAELQALRGPPDAATPFTIDTQPPSTSFTSTPPVADAPPSATFQLAASEPVRGFECSLDGAPFAPCPQAATFDRLGPGRHTLAARAIDLAGNVDPAPAHYEWAVRALSLVVVCGAAEGTGPLALGMALWLAWAVRARRARR